MKEIIGNLVELGIVFNIEGESLSVDAPSGTLTSDIKKLISENKKSIIDYLKSKSNNTEISCNSNPKDKYLPFQLNDIQYAYYLGRDKNFAFGGVASHYYYEIECANIDLQRLEESFNVVIKRHDMLRAIVTPEGEQKILEKVDKFEFEKYDLSSLDDTAANVETSSLRNLFSHTIIDVNVWPPYKIRSAELANNKIKLFFSWDFIFLDAWSLLIIFKEWNEFYNNPDFQPEEISFSFRDYVLHENRIKETEEYIQSKQYWLDRVETLPVGPQLPISKKSGQLNPKFQRRCFELPNHSWEALKVKAVKLGVTPTSLLLAVFSEVLGKWSSTNHFSINLTTFNRRQCHESVNALVGDFTNLLLVEATHDVNTTFKNRIKNIHHQLLRDLDHKDVSAVDIIRQISKKRKLQYIALFPVVFTSTLILNGRRNSDTSHLECFGPVTWGISQTPQVWLDYQMFDKSGALVINWDALEDLFLPGVLDLMFEDNKKIIYSLIESDDIWDVSEILRPIDEVNFKPEQGSSTVSLLHSKFIELSLHEPRRIAIESQGISISYGELYLAASNIHYDLHAAGAMPGDRVIICCRKGWEQVAAILAVFFIGGSYVPVDPSWPIARRDQIIKDCNAKVVLTNDYSVSESLHQTAIAIHIGEHELSRPSSNIALANVTSDSTAYIIFTSGSTGKPKGVEITHKAALNTVESINHLFNISSSDKCLAVSELSFDLSVYDIFGMLSSGGIIVFPEWSEKPRPEDWINLIQQHKITIWNSVPQLMVLLTNLLYESNVTNSLKLIMLSGDWIPINLPQKITSVFKSSSVVSLGGATECSIWSIYYPINEIDSSWDSIPYGKALPNQEVYVLDSTLNKCPLGVEGELYIAGQGLALGYWNDLEKTQEKFINHPKTNIRLYKTGDLGRYLQDGNIEFLGRQDHQVKIRGYRIELGEISSVLSKLDAIDDVVVSRITKETTDDIAVFIKLNNMQVSDSFNEQTIREHLKEYLPEYMIPKYILFTDNFPLTANGKVDSASLSQLITAEPVNTPKTANYNNTKLQKELLNIWRDVLKRENVGTSDNFFEIGGDSLLLSVVLRKINELAIKTLTMTELFAYPTIKLLSNYLGDENLEITDTDFAHNVANDNHDVAVIGYSGRFPDADSVDDFWENILKEKCSTRTLSKADLCAYGISEEYINNPKFVRAQPVFENIDLFDADFFGITPEEARFMDPQVRILLEHGYGALEHAGYPTEQHAGKIGVFITKGAPWYMVNRVLTDSSFVEKYGIFSILNGHDKDHAATMVSYQLNLTGPSLSIGTSCSSSLVAVHTACKYLFDGECNIALAGGVSLTNDAEFSGYEYEEGGIKSPDGYCRPFSTSANGTVFAGGVGIVVLKRLDQAIKDKDTIHAIIKGSAINNDGARKVGYTAPSELGQVNVIKSAQKNSGINFSQIGYLEAHGTGTKIGDQIEVRALKKVFDKNFLQSQKIYLGSVKSNIGHLDVAAGIVGFIKTVNVLKYQKVPATIHAESVNSDLGLEGSSFVINSKTITPDVEIKYGAVSSFGVGGTNSHVILERYAESPSSNLNKINPQLFVLSAKTIEALKAIAKNLLIHLKENASSSLESLAYTLQLGRVHHEYRASFIAASKEEVVDELNNVIKKSSDSFSNSIEDSTQVIFAYSGQTSINHDVASYLYSTNITYKNSFDLCVEIIESYTSINISRIFGENIIDFGELLQPTLFSIQYALSSYWQSLGIKPSVVLGHSIGEYAAACVAKVFSLEEALALLVVRGKLSESTSAGKMLAVCCTEILLKSYLNDSNCSLAAVNSLEQCVISGAPHDIDEISEKLTGNGIRCVQLEAKRAFHSSLLDPVIDSYQACVAETRIESPSISFLSSLTGNWLSEGEMNTNYWVSQFRNPVRYADSMLTLRQSHPQGIVLEVGIGDVLSRFAKDYLFQSFHSLDASNEGGRKSTLRAIGALWERGVDIDWLQMSGHESFGRAPIPGYPYEKKSFWIGEYRSLNVLLNSDNMGQQKENDLKVVEKNSIQHENEFKSIEEIGNVLEKLWIDYLGVERIDNDDDFFALGGDSFRAIKIFNAIENLYEANIPRSHMFKLSKFSLLKAYIAITVDTENLDALPENEVDELYNLIGS